MNGLALCPGLGGLELGLRLALGDSYHTVGYIEREGPVAAILAARMADGSLDEAPIWDDLESFDGRPWRGRVDLVSAGFPCQPWSVAGQRRGTEDERWLWPGISRIIREVGPGLVFLENVPGLLAGGLGHVLSDLATLGFDAEWGVFGADDVGAPHRRKRVFVLGVSDAGRGLLRQEQGRGEPGWAGAAEPSRHREKLADESSRAGALLPRARRPGEAGRDAQGGRGELADAAFDLGRGGIVGEEAGTRTAGERRRGFAGGGTHLGDTDLEALEARRPHEPGRLPGPFPPSPGDRDAWADVLAEHPGLSLATAQPRVRGVADGASDRMDRLRALGNAVIPAVAATAFRSLAENFSK